MNCKTPSKRLLFVVPYMIPLLFFIVNSCGLARDNNDKPLLYIMVKGSDWDAVNTILFDSLIITDPFILADENTSMYYLTGSGGAMWKSHDLQSWEGPFSYLEIDTTSWMGQNPLIWAPELYFYKGKYYCFVTFTNLSIVIDKIPKRCELLRRGIHILVAEKAEGPYRSISEDPYLLEEWSTLDGTFYVENNVPYLVFSHDWMQQVNGEIKYIQLAEDLSHTIGETATLFKGNDAPWTREMQSIGELTFGMSLRGYVTEGPFLFRTETGWLGMLWSSWGVKRNVQGVAYSQSGSLEGPWNQQEQPLVEDHAGHGMLFKTFEGKNMLVLHSQPLGDNPGPRRPMLLEVDLTGNLLKIKGRYNP